MLAKAILCAAAAALASAITAVPWGERGQRGVLSCADDIPPSSAVLPVAEKGARPGSAAPSGTRMTVVEICSGSAVTTLARAPMVDFAAR